MSQLAGQLDLLDLLEEMPGTDLQKPYYKCVCGARLDCDAPAAVIAQYSIDHRAHVEEFALAQWAGDTATLTTKAPHPINLGMRYTCPCCLSNWGELKSHVLERHRAEHEEVEPGICRLMLWIRGKLDALHRGEWEPTLVWSDDSKAHHLAGVTASYDTLWAHYNETKGSQS